MFHRHLPLRIISCTFCLCVATTRCKGFTHRGLSHWCNTGSPLSIRARSCGRCIHTLKRWANQVRPCIAITPYGCDGVCVAVQQSCVPRFLMRDQNRSRSLGVSSFSVRVLSAVNIYRVDLFFLLHGATDPPPQQEDTMGIYGKKYKSKRTKTKAKRSKKRSYKRK